MPYEIRKTSRPSFTRRIRTKTPTLWIEQMCDNGTTTERGSGALTPCPRHGSEGSMRGQSISERFWSKVERRDDDECWEWTGSRLPSGYGQLFVGSRVDGTRGTQRAHRVAYELAHGPIPEGMLVCHSCDNPPCVNTRHLFLGSQTDNMRDMAGKGRTGAHSGEAHWTRSQPERLSRGERHVSARLTESDVRAIRALAVQGVAKKKIARDFNVGRTTVQHVIRRDSWKHIV